MDEEYQKLLMEEQAELATSIQCDAALTALQAQNEAALKEMLQLEQELNAVTSENETLSRFKGFSQEQCFFIKAENYKIAGEKQKVKEMLHGLDQQETYWKNVGKKEEEAGKSFDAHLAGFYKSPWILQKQELKGEIQQLRDLYTEKEQEFAKMDNTTQFKSPNNMDTNTLEMFRNMVRSELRLNPARAASLQQQLLNDSVASSNVATPPRPARPQSRRLEATSSPSAGRHESTPSRKQKEPSRRISSSPSLQPTPPPSQQQQYQQHHVEIEPLEDDSNLTANRMEFDDSVRQSQETEQEEEYEDGGEEEEEPEEEPNDMYNNDLSSDAANDEDIASHYRQRMLSPVHATPPDARPKPAQNYAPRDDDHLFKVPETPRRRNASPPKNNNVAADDDMNFMNMDASLDNGMDLNTSQDGGNDFYNLLGDNGGGSNDGPMFSFLQEQTNNSDAGGNNFFFGATSSPRAQKDDSSHGFLF